MNRLNILESVRMRGYTSRRRRPTTRVWLLVVGTGVLELRWPRVTPVPYYQTLYQPSPTLTSPSTMATSEPWGVDGIPPTVEHHQAITTILNTDIETLTVLKGTLKATPIKPIFESVIAILTLVRVRLLAPFPLLHSLTGDTARTR